RASVTVPGRWPCHGRWPWRFRPEWTNKSGRERRRRADPHSPPLQHIAHRGLGAEALVCAPPDEEFAELLERVGVPLVPLGPTVRSIVANPKPPTAQDAFRLAPALV